jgi:GH18 family chitinase
MQPAAATDSPIPYDDAESIQGRVKHIREFLLGGAMVWKMGSDGGKLLQTLGASLCAD